MRLAIAMATVLLANVSYAQDGKMTDKPWNSINVTSHNQSGGITAHTVNIGSQPRDLHSPWGVGLKAQILRDLPRDREISVTSLLGDGETFQLATQIFEFLKANNFKMKEDGISQAVFSAPIKGLQFNPDNSTFIVGSKE